MKLKTILLSNKTRFDAIPYLFAIVTLFITFLNETFHWPIMRFFNVYASNGFIDLQYVLRRADCYHDLGNAVYTSGGYSLAAGWNTCFNYWYGETLLIFLSRVRLGLENTLVLGYFLIGLFSFLYGKLIEISLRLSYHKSRLAVTSLLVLYASPITWFLVQRGNIDLLIASLIICSYFLFTNGRYLLAFFLLFVATVFKFYTVPALFVIALWASGYWRKIFYLCGSLFATFLVLSSYSKVPGLKQKLDSMEQLFGFKYMSTWLNATLTFEINARQELALNFLVFAVTFFVCLPVLWKNIEVKEPGSHPSPLLTFGPIAFFIYFFGANVDYRLVLVVLILILVLMLNDEVIFGDFERIFVVFVIVISFACLLSYPSGKLQILGDFSVSLLISFLLVAVLKRIRMLVTIPLGARS